MSEYYGAYNVSAVFVSFAYLFLDTHYLKKLTMDLRSLYIDSILFEMCAWFQMNDYGLKLI